MQSEQSQSTSMHLIHPGLVEALLCQRAVRAAVLREGYVPPAARALMLAAQQAVLHIDADIDSLPDIDPAELAAGIKTPGLADQLVQAMLVGILADGEPAPENYARVEAFADALGIDAPALRTVRLLCEHHTVLFRLNFLRRSPLKGMFADQYLHRGGIIGLARGVLGASGLYEDKALAQRYIALGELPPGTLGHTYFHHCRNHGFPFPGERRGFPEGGVYHDLSHILAGYDTSPEGEVQVAAFIAGYKKVNPFYVLLIPVFLFGAGVNVTPAAQPHITGILAEPGLADKFIAAVERGSQVNTDLSDGWDFWPLMPVPLAEVRSRLNIS
jgi:hypothetical protein